MDKQTFWQLKGVQTLMFFRQTRNMSTTKAFPTVPMPEHNIHTVRVLFHEAQMSDRHFRIFTVRFNNIKYTC